MSETKPIYSGEAVLRGRGESDKAGVWVRLELEDAGGVHPFKGFEGERFAVVIVGPLASDGHANLVLGEDASGERPAQPRDKGAAEGTGAMRADPSSPKTKRRWVDMPASQRAALLTKDREFQLFTSWVLALKDEPASEAVANEFILTRCCVESKSTLDNDKGERRFFRDQFNKIESEFEAWRQARGHGVV